MAINMVKLPTQKQDLVLRVAKGHFATSHSHINYYIDVTMQKTRLSEARAVALELVSSYTHTTIVDTILCLDGTEVIGACMASELTCYGHIHQITTRYRRLAASGIQTFEYRFYQRI